LLLLGAPLLPVLVLLLLGALLVLLVFALLLLLRALLLLPVLVLLLLRALLLLFVLVLLLSLFRLSLLLLLFLFRFSLLLLLFLFGLSLLLLFRGLSLFLLRVRGSNGSEKKEQNSRTDKSNWFHECCLHADRSGLLMLRHRSLLTGLVPRRLFVQSGQEQFRRRGRANGTIDYDLLRADAFSVHPRIAIAVGAES